MSLPIKSSKPLPVKHFHYRQNQSVTEAAGPALTGAALGSPEEPVWTSVRYTLNRC